MMGFVKKLIYKPIKVYKTIINILLNNKTKEEKIETMMVVVILSVLLLSLLDTFVVDNIKFTRWVEIYDLIVCGIFLVDLGYRFKNWEDTKTKFLKKSWLEIIAIIPFDMVFRFFRLARVFRLLKIGKVSNLSKMSKLGRTGNTFFKMSKGVLNTSFLSFMKTGSYIRFKRFKKVLFGKYGFGDDK